MEKRTKTNLYEKKSKAQLWEENLELRETVDELRAVNAKNREAVQRHDQILKALEVRERQVRALKMTLITLIEEMKA